MESVNFTLKSTDIAWDNQPLTYFGKTISINSGIVKENRSSLTWNNVNLRTILGELYDRYDKFNISLSFLAMGEGGTVVEAISDYRTFYVKMSGLNFISSYSQLTQKNSGSVILTTIQLPSGEVAWIDNYLAPQFFTFNKNESVTINIDLICVYDDLPYAPATLNQMLGHMSYGFNITGCEDYKNDKNNANQNIDLNLRKIF